MSNSVPVQHMSHSYSREQTDTLETRLREPRQFIQVVSGARQVGKTTLVGQALARIDTPVRSVSADEPGLKDSTWLTAQWEAVRIATQTAGPNGGVLAIDEIQKISGWSETVKRLWDEDTASGLALRVVILGAAPLLLQTGLTESLAGRFEQIRVPHWSFGEMRDAFDVSLNEYLYFGGYPGAASLRHDQNRWARYIVDSMIETTLSKDILLITRVDKPALMRRLFELGCRYSGQILSYTKVLGQLQDAGNTTTLAHYLNLLSGVGMLTGLQKYAGDTARRYGSSPKFQVLNTALMSAMTGYRFEEALADPEYRGRLVESAVGAHLANAAATGICELYYWRDRGREVDFVVRAGRRLVAIEVKSAGSGTSRTHRGLSAFARSFNPDRSLIVGGDGISLEEFLSAPVAHWL